MHFLRQKLDFLEFSWPWDTCTNKIIMPQPHITPPLRIAPGCLAQLSTLVAGCSAEIIILPPVIIYDGSQYIALYHCPQPQQAASFRNKNSKEPLSLGQEVKLGCWSVGGIWALDHSKGRLSTFSTYGQLGHQRCIVGHFYLK